MDKRPLLIGLLWDVGLPAVVFYAGRSFGLGVIWALTAGAVAALVRVGCVAAVRHRLDGLAALVGTSFVLLLAASLLTGDPGSCWPGSRSCPAPRGCSWWAPA